MVATRPAVPITQVFKALSEPVRWEIVEMMRATDELACTTLESVLGVTKSTISYHIKILYFADLIEVRKEGRYYFYRLRRDVFDRVLNEMASAATEEPGDDGAIGSPRRGRVPALRG
jgi:DNA-binding transcriptional ArsR family regulator